jgi:hypothetical protein
MTIDLTEFELEARYFRPKWISFLITPGGENLNPIEGSLVVNFGIGYVTGMWIRQCSY